MAYLCPGHPRLPGHVPDQCHFCQRSVNAAALNASPAPRSHQQLGIHQPGPYLLGTHIGICWICKYLLMLVRITWNSGDSRCDWWSQILVAADLMAFIKNLEKSGLYLLGHVKVGLLGKISSLWEIKVGPEGLGCSNTYRWVALGPSAEQLGLLVVSRGPSQQQGFVNLTVADSVRRAVQSLKSPFCHRIWVNEAQHSRVGFLWWHKNRPGALVLRVPQCAKGCESKDLQEEEYRSLVADALKMGKKYSIGSLLQSGQPGGGLGVGRKGRGPLLCDQTTHRLMASKCTSTGHPGLPGWMSVQPSCCSWPVCSTRGLTGPRRSFVSFCARRLAAGRGGKAARPAEGAQDFG